MPHFAPSRRLRRLLLALPLWLVAASGFRPAGPRRATVYVFLADACPISQQVTLPLRQLHAAYAPQGVAFVGVFPGPDAASETLAAFAKTYQLSFPLQADPGHRLARRFGARVTPEAVVVGPDGQTVLYQGRVDDQYAALGRRRTLAQHHELADALAAVAAGRPVPVRRTEAVGCLIESQIGAD